MQVTGNFFQPQNSFLNVAGVNQSLARRAGGGARRDRASISPQGKMMNAIQNMAKQRDAIAQKKNELIGKTLEDGGDLDSIQEQVKLYEEQIGNLDKQIAQIKASQMKEAAEKDEKKDTKKQDEGQTGEQAGIERLSRIANAAMDVQNAQAVSSVKGRIEGEIRVEEAEIQLGEIQIDTVESKLGGGKDANAIISHIRDSLEQKEDVISELRDKTQDLIEDEQE